MTQPTENTDLFAIAQNAFDRFTSELISYGIKIDPQLELRRGNGMWVYYDLQDRHIYFGLPDFSLPEGKLHLFILRSLLSCDSNAEFYELGRLLIPYVVAHEIGHHLRHKYGLFSNDGWHEEQVANQLAIALTEHWLTVDQRDQYLAQLSKAITALQSRMTGHETALTTHHDLWQVLHHSQQVNETTLHQMQLTQRLFAVDPAEMLESMGHPTEFLAQRQNLIEEMNTNYATNLMRYLFYQLNWLYLDLVYHERHYVSSFARQHLGLMPRLLPMVSAPQQVTQEAILACYQAYQETIATTTVIGHYFYKRYRSHLLTYLQELPQQTERLRQEAGFVLQDGCLDEVEGDLLNYLDRLAPPDAQSLFPYELQQASPLKLNLPATLPTETDRALYQYTLGEIDTLEASQTAHYLYWLDQVEVFRCLPAEVWLELLHASYLVNLAPGEAIIQDGVTNHDVYLLIEGELVVTYPAAPTQPVYIFQPGELVGAWAFVTRKPRVGTVRAKGKATCGVLRDLEFHLLSFKNPTLILEMAKAFASKLRLQGDDR